MGHLRCCKKNAEDAKNEVVSKFAGLWVATLQRGWGPLPATMNIMLPGDGHRSSLENGIDIEYYQDLEEAHRLWNAGEIDIDTVAVLGAGEYIGSNYWTWIHTVLTSIELGFIYQVSKALALSQS
jgi:hypothetical protein